MEVAESAAVEASESAEAKADTPFPEPEPETEVGTDEKPDPAPAPTPRPSPEALRAAADATAALAIAEFAQSPHASFVRDDVLPTTSQSPSGKLAVQENELPDGTTELHFTSVTNADAVLTVHGAVSYPPHHTVTLRLAKNQRTVNRVTVGGQYHATLVTEDGELLDVMTHDGATDE